LSVLKRVLAGFSFVRNRGAVKYLRQKSQHVERGSRIRASISPSAETPEIPEEVYAAAPPLR
jgi:hypothetical protein